MVTPAASRPAQPPASAVRFATLSDAGTLRLENEDACGSHETEAGVVLAVADGVSGEEGGEIASRTAIDETLRAYRESPVAWGPARRLYRAAQQANIEIYDRAAVVTELRRMATTLTAIAVEDGIAYAAHVGDSRLYLIRNGRIEQKTKDHTVAATRQRIGVVSAKRAKDHPLRSTLTRSLGSELIAAIDRVTFPVRAGDTLLVCSDGLYNVLNDDQLCEGTSGRDAEKACKALIDEANGRGAPDNITVAIAQVMRGATADRGPGWRELLARLIGRAAPQ
jgi:serine/threonine protein phosphatase PrpC